jgi:hypothetical protein
MIVISVARQKKSARHRLAIFVMRFALIGSLESLPSNLLKATRKPDILVFPRATATGDAWVHAPPQETPGSKGI